jgi:hypothetical protein
MRIDRTTTACGATVLRQRKYTILVAVLLALLVLQSFAITTGSESTWHDVMATVLEWRYFKIVYSGVASNTNFRIALDRLGTAASAEQMYDMPATRPSDLVSDRTHSTPDRYPQERFSFGCVRACGVHLTGALSACITIPLG